MAATRLIAIHHIKGKSMMQCLKDRIEYSLNPAKTEKGEHVSFYECTPEAVVEEFALSKREYEHITGRNQRYGVIAYMIRQSFKPGEITAQEANRVGYELAMRFTKGRHAFFVATHTDREHIHNHIFFNSTTLDCRRKFKNFFLSGRAVQKISDLICVENSLSVIEPKTYSERIKENRHKDSISKRDLIRRDIDQALEQQPKNMEMLLKLLSEMGYEIKSGKQTALKKKEDSRYVRFRSLGSGYTAEDLQLRFTKNVKVPKKRKGYQKKLSLLIDIQEKIKEGKGGGYTHWAKVFNVKQMAQTILFLQEHEYESFEQLDAATNDVVKKFHQVSEKLKVLEKQVKESKEIKKQIINYSKTRDVYVEYRKAGYSKKFFGEHREEILMHKAAKEVFDHLDVSKIPKVKELNQQISDTYDRKRNVADEYYQLQKEMREMMIVRENVRTILNDEENKIKKSKNLEKIFY